MAVYGAAPLAAGTRTRVGKATALAVGVMALGLAVCLFAPVFATAPVGSFQKRVAAQEKYLHEQMKATTKHSLSSGNGRRVVVGGKKTGGKSAPVLKAKAVETQTKRQAEQHAAAATAANKQQCRTVTAADAACHQAVSWAISTGIHSNPEWYGGLSASSSLEAFQCALVHMKPATACTIVPCGHECAGPAAAIVGVKKVTPVDGSAKQAAAPAVAAAAGCVDDLGCELLGKCVSGVCQCNPGFVGKSCGQLDLLPVDKKMHGRVWPLNKAGGAKPTEMAWSFAPVFDPTANKYRAVVEVGCGPTWNEGFYMAALSSTNPGGGWTFDRWISTANVNSPHLIYDKATKKFVLHFQSGRTQWPADLKKIKTCSGSGHKAPALTSLAIRPCEAGEFPLKNSCICSMASHPSSNRACDTPITTSGIQIATFSDWDAPESWEVHPIAIDGTGWKPFNATVPSLGMSNPSAVRLANGKSVIAFRSHLKAGYWPGVKGEHLGFSFGDGIHDRAYTVTANLTYKGQSNDEDPFLWQQPDGSVHCVYHNGRGHTQNLGLHAFSNDFGVTWHQPADSESVACKKNRQCGALYTNTMKVVGGGTFSVVGRERPTILFDPVSGLPTHLFNGAIPDYGVKGGYYNKIPWYSMVQGIRH